MLPIVLPLTLVGVLTGAGLATSRRGLSLLPKSPVEGVVVVRWVRFTRTLARHPLGYDAPGGRMGMFGLHARRLADVGLAQNPRKETIGSEVGVWTADWQKPLSKKTFLASPPLQYEAFKRSVVDMVPKVSGLVGAVIDGEKCTLSGLLGVGHVAGSAGVAGWVKDPAVRKKFQNTTNTFNLTNGIF